MPEPNEPSLQSRRACRSLVSGVVTAVHVRPGERFHLGDALVIIEDRKAETEIKAPSDGIVSIVNVTIGDRIQPGQILLEFE